MSIIAPGTKRWKERRAEDRIALRYLMDRPDEFVRADKHKGLSGNVAYRLLIKRYVQMRMVTYGRNGYRITPKGREYLSQLEGDEE